jgi:type II secretory pathway pseudopilin PulG
VELLVVLATIGILAALLLPALSRAKESARSIRCRANEKTIGLALEMYSTDTGFYPHAWFTGHLASVPVNRPTTYWFDCLALYLADSKWGTGIYKCPSYRWRVSEREGAPGGSYAYNGRGQIHWREGDPYRCFGLGDNYDPFAVSPWGRLPPIRQQDVRAPSDMYAMGDAPVEHWYDLNWNMGETGYWGGITDEGFGRMAHPLVANMLFVDDHVEGVNKTDLLRMEPKFYVRWNNDHQPDPEM